MELTQLITENLQDIKNDRAKLAAAIQDEQAAGGSRCALYIEQDRNLASTQRTLMAARVQLAHPRYNCMAPIRQQP